MQGVVKQHPILEKMNPSSLNTIRVVSFFFEGEVYILSIILRMGAKNARVDNIGAGDLRAKFMRMADCMNLGSIERRNG